MENYERSIIHESGHIIASIILGYKVQNSVILNEPVNHNNDIINISGATTINRGKDSYISDLIINNNYDSSINEAFYIRVALKTMLMYASGSIAEKHFYDKEDISNDIWIEGHDLFILDRIKIFFEYNFKISDIVQDVIAITIPLFKYDKTKVIINELRDAFKGNHNKLNQIQIEAILCNYQKEFKELQNSLEGLIY